MPGDARQRKGPTGTIIVWIFLLAVAALLVMVIYTFAATDEGPPPQQALYPTITSHRSTLTKASSDDHRLLTKR